MRLESTTIAKAFLAKKSKKSHRTYTDGTTLYLHNHAIAWHNSDGSLSMTLAGWPTVTTRDRLNTLCMLAFGNKPFHQKKGVQYRDDMPISAETVFTYHPVITIDAQSFFADAA